MKKDNLPICDSESSIKDIINKITDGKCGLVIVVDNENIKGVITDGDIRRAMETKQDEFFSLEAKDIMSINPKLIKSNEKLIQASEAMSEAKINSLIVVDESDKLTGIVQMYDLGV